MKTRKIFLILVVSLFLSGCFVASFFPLYTRADLHPDTLMAGQWLNEDSTLWAFEYISVRENDKPALTDSTGYTLTFREKGGKMNQSAFEVRVVRLEETCFLDFFIKEIDREGYPDFFDLHTMAIHTFARVTLDGDTLHLNWMDPEWLKKLAEEEKLKTRHLVRDGDILLTANPIELQKFMIQSIRVREAWEDGTTFKLTRTGGKTPG